MAKRRTYIRDTRGRFALAEATDEELAEAKAKGANGEQSFDQQSERIRQAWRAAHPRSPLDPYGESNWIRDVFDDHVVVTIGDDTLRVPYSEKDGDVVFDEAGAKKVEQRYVVIEAHGIPEDDGFFLGPVVEATDTEPQGWVWDVVVIESGTSKNGFDYTPEALERSLQLFEGARVLERSDSDHLQGKNKRVKNIVGWLTAPQWDATNKRVVARLNISEAAGWLRTMLLDAWKRGKKNLAGLSIVGAGRGRKVRRGRAEVAVVETLEAISSVDVVVDPSAGGGLLKLVAAVREEEHVDPKLFAALIKGKKPEQVRQILAEAEASTEDIDELKEALKADHADAVELIEAAMKLPEPKPAAAAPAQSDPAAAAPAAPATPLAEAARKPDDDQPEQLTGYVARFAIREAISDKGSRLPEVVQKRLTKQFEKRLEAGTGFTEVELTEAIEDEIGVWAELEKTGVRAPVATGHGSVRDDHIGVGVEERERAKAALDGLFLGEAVEVEGEKVQPYRGIKHAYMDLTGDGLRNGGLITGQLAECEGGKLGLREGRGMTDLRLHHFNEQGELVLREAIQTTTFAEVLGDSIRRKMVRDYQNLASLLKWRELVDVVRTTDFRTNHITRLGFYGNLPAVAQAANYALLTSPTDEEATYAVTKRGGLERVTLETIANDDMGAIRRIPGRLARAAAHTLNEFVFNFLNNNPTIYDAVALFHLASHANLLTTALSGAALSAARLQMLKQTEMDSGKRLGIGPRHLVVPLELEETAWQLTTSERVLGSNNNDPNFARRMNMNVITVEYWTDVNNWYTVADPADIPTIELGFYGNEDPDLFTQDNPQVGSLFDSDQITYKLRHVYGGAVVDYRGFQGNLVA